MSDYEDRVRENSKEQSDSITSEGFIGKTKLSNLVKIEGKDRYSGKNLTTATKNIKRIIKDMYPELLMVKVTSDRFAGGDSIHATIIYDVATNEKDQEKFSEMASKIDEIISVFSDSGFDGMTDSSFSVRNSINENYGSSKYVDCGARSYYEDEESSFLKKKANAEKKELMKVLKQKPISSEIIKKRI